MQARVREALGEAEWDDQKQADEWLAEEDLPPAVAQKVKFLTDQMGAGMGMGPG